jgi:hypothetical protein
METQRSAFGAAAHQVAPEKFGLRQLKRRLEQSEKASIRATKPQF